MAKLIYIEASPRKKRAASIAVANTFLENYRKAHPQDEVHVIDLWKKDLPPFSGDIIDAKYAIMHGQPHTEEQRRGWKAVEDLIAEFKTGDKFLVSTPMWNFGIPYKLKHYIDLLVQPGYTFMVTPEGEYKGLVTGKKVALIYARGGAYGSGDALDLQIRYMETILGFIGFQNFQKVVIEPTLAGSPEEKKKMLEAAQEKAKQLATKF
jgi:FMN-dependent NADH-azoreductase